MIFLDRAATAFCAAALSAALAAAPAAAQDRAGPAPTRGQLLYTTHCIACHNSQMHWRDQKIVTDWASLKRQVRHWQGVALLNWNDADIAAVARHLNDTIYRFAQTSDLLSKAGPGRP